MALDAQTEALLKRLHANPADDVLLEQARERLLSQGQYKTLVKLLQWCASKAQTPQRAAALFLEAGGVLKQSHATLDLVLAAYASVDSLQVDDRWRALGAHARAAAIVDLGGDQHEAVALLEKALVFDPNLDHAAALLARLLETAPEPAVRTRAANLYTRLGERGGGEAYFRRALSIHPTCEMALAHLEVALLDSGRSHELVPYWEGFVNALEQRAGTASARAESHVRCQLATHLAQQGQPTKARQLLQPVKESDSPSVVALLEELGGRDEGDASQVAFLAALDEAEESEITREDVAARLSSPPVWASTEVDRPMPGRVRVPEREEQDDDFPKTAPAARPMRASGELEGEKTHLRSDEGPMRTAPRQSVPPAQPRSRPTYTGWAPPEGTRPIIEEDPDDRIVMDQHAMQRLFGADDPTSSKSSKHGHTVEVVNFRDETALSVHAVEGRFHHTKLAVRHTSKGAKVSFPRGFTSANITRSGRGEALSPGTTDAELALGDRLDVTSSESRFTVSVRPRAVAPRAAADINWKRHSYSIAGSFAVHMTLLIGLALVVMLGAAPPVVDTRSQEEIFAETRLKPPPVEKAKPKPRPVRLTKKKVPKPAPDREVKIPKSLRKTLRRISKRRDRSAKDATDRAVSALRTPLGGEGQTLSEAVTNLDAAKGGEKSGAFRVGGTLAALDSKGVNIASGGGGDIGTLRAGSATKNLDRLSKREGRTRGRVSSIAALSKVQGSLSRGEVMAVINRNIGKIQRCYEQGLARRDSLSGRVGVRWTIAPSGRVSSARQASSTLGDRKVESCVVRVVKRMKFPKPSGGPVSVSFPFVFQRSN